MHIMTGNLSHQIEHHLFPDLPSNRYGELAPKIQDIFQRYGLSYVTGPLPKQVGSAWAKVFRLSLPNRKPAADGSREAAAERRKAAMARGPAKRWQRATSEPVG
jgi:linoleoyl-CoA desaturase